MSSQLATLSQPQTSPVYLGFDRAQSYDILGTLNRSLDVKAVFQNTLANEDSKARMTLNKWSNPSKKNRWCRKGCNASPHLGLLEAMVCIFRLTLVLACRYLTLYDVN